MTGPLAHLEGVGYAAPVATVSETLRTALTQCGESRYAVSRATGIPESVLSRFHHGQPLRGANLDRLADYLGLELRPKTRSRKGR